MKKEISVSTQKNITLNFQTEHRYTHTFILANARPQQAIDLQLCFRKSVLVGFVFLLGFLTLLPKLELAVS
ncbi:MAG: hypothetical protein NT164_08910 [Verrucomicrobiae bacterium]|nr:hypothetical protein [Verrucomicrobiae bacterium]